jgi:hypothetical protein
MVSFHLAPHVAVVEVKAVQVGIDGAMGGWLCNIAAPASSTSVLGEVSAPRALTSDSVLPPLQPAVDGLPHQGYAAARQWVSPREPCNGTIVLEPPLSVMAMGSPQCC